MKKLFFATALLLASATTAFAQVVVDGVNINNLEEVQMVRMIAQERFLSNKVTIFIDYGQSINGGSRNRMEVIDPNSGDRIRFNSVMHAVNYLIANGWTYVEAMVLPSEGNASTTGGSTQYLFVRNFAR
ncbi:hypothetical protein LEM8419_01532 [Neolewinella maritima]|uniref:Uncharacterized protein n=1 Tax=Neolewinella maritima TaxID=1383882 RepID=A0ABM9AZW8_9BACT|nr:hypothetical protein [Neolewinella maritima]CAH1000379.1 hypothetical protein LEM8419_01532 [Neolewinella maritima]